MEKAREAPFLCLNTKNKCSNCFGDEFKLNSKGGFATLALACEFLFPRAEKGTKKALFRYHGDIRSVC